MESATASSSSSPPVNDEILAPKPESDHQLRKVMDECVHRTKTIQFFGRTTPIILQNDNGPCPLLAICNILLLRNNLKLSPDISEVSQEKLLSLVAERLIDSNSNADNKDAGYLENQQQNIADAMNLLPRLTTGIDVNVKFRRIDDFEFTPECAIFDLLDIPLCHGWIVDPQDYETSIAIGSKSYNAITGELVALDTQNMEDTHKNNSEDCVDFAAATAATLGVPSPRSFESSPSSIHDFTKLRMGDLEEEAELLRALKLSETDSPTKSSLEAASGIEDKRKCPGNNVPADSLSTREVQDGAGNQNLQFPEPSLSNNSNNGDQICNKNIAKEKVSSPSKIDGADHDVELSPSPLCEDFVLLNDAAEKGSIESMVVEKNNASEVLHMEDVVSLSSVKDAKAVDESSNATLHVAENPELQLTSTSNALELADNVNGRDTADVSSLSLPNADSESSSGRILNSDVTSSVDDSEPIYEGEECILDSGTKVYEEREPVYEGEVILAEQAEKGTVNTGGARSKDEITPEQGELIRNFLKNNASQLTIYGLFCLQEGLKERELCVFFRNNHFGTMFKYEGELYLLATDQGYLNQPDLVWEKLNEVNGDTLFMTCNFKEFKVDDNHASNTWNEHNAMANTADFISSIDTAAQAGLDITSDLQLAIALQQQEFEQQPQRHNNVQQQQQQQQPSQSVGSRMIVGPQVSRSNGRQPSTPKAETKSKDKCTVM